MIKVNTLFRRTAISCPLSGGSVIVPWVLRFAFGEEKVLHNLLFVVLDHKVLACEKKERASTV
jgi:hypothetical protein